MKSCATLATRKMSQEKPATLQATALVHEAYIRVVGMAGTTHWESRGHFFAAAAEAMRRILIDQVRRKRAEKRGGNRHRGGTGRMHFGPGAGWPTDRRSHRAG
jgi:DNA-directed RNA polymerase specialized sigma24 family protein